MAGGERAGVTRNGTAVAGAADLEAADGSGWSPVLRSKKVLNHGTPLQTTWRGWTCEVCARGDDPAQAFLRHGRLALGRELDYGTPGTGHVRLDVVTSPEHLAGAIRRLDVAATAA